MQTILFIKAARKKPVEQLEAKSRKLVDGIFDSQSACKKNAKMVSLGVITKARMKLSSEKETVGVQ